jgi:hypothetical protein
MAAIINSALSSLCDLRIGVFKSSPVAKDLSAACEPPHLTCSYFHSLLHQYSKSMCATSNSPPYRVKYDSFTDAAAEILPSLRLDISGALFEWSEIGTYKHSSSFYNSVWLILNDAIVGYAVGAYLSENQDWIGQQLVDLTKVSLR